MPTIFGFPEFLSALALLGIVYTITDIRYKFRTNIAPIPLHNSTFIIVGLIGIFTLILSVFEFGIPFYLLPLSQAVLGLAFFSLFLVWIYFGVINPPIFSLFTCKKYLGELYKLINKGLENELPVIANELERSCRNLVVASATIPERTKRHLRKSLKEMNRKEVYSDVGYEVLLLIGDPNFCHHIVKYSPVTAINLLNEISESKKYGLPISQFMYNISIKAITNKNSILYHEKSAYISGLRGYLKEFTYAVYGDSRLINSLTNPNPFDFPHEYIGKLDKEQFDIYCSVLSITFENQIAENGVWHRPQFLSTALEFIESSANHSLLKENINQEFDEKINISVRLLDNLVSILESKDTSVNKVKFRVKNNFDTTVYDLIANTYLSLILSASRADLDEWKSWWINHNIIWTTAFGGEDTRARNLVRFKLRRLIYDEIKNVAKSPNYRSTAIIGYCIHVMGFDLKKIDSSNRYYSLYKVVIDIAKKNFLKLFKQNSDLANNCLIGNISFDEQNSRLVKTYPKLLLDEVKKDYLYLLE